MSIDFNLQSNGRYEGGKKSPSKDFLSLGTSTSIITAKESPRFRPNRALDAHFRFRVADVKPLGTIAPNLVYSSPRTLPTLC